jgi:hypothetical protein
VGSADLARIKFIALSQTPMHLMLEVSIKTNKRLTNDEYGQDRDDPG